MIFTLNWIVSIEKLFSFTQLDKNVAYRGKGKRLA